MGGTHGRECVQIAEEAVASGKWAFEKKDGSKRKHSKLVHLATGIKIPFSFSSSDVRAGLNLRADIRRIESGGPIRQAPGLPTRTR